MEDDANLCEIRRFQELRSDGRDGEIGGDGIIGEASDITELLSLLSEDRIFISPPGGATTVGEEIIVVLEARPIS